MAAIAGSVIAARIRGIPILLDGFVSTASAATLTIFDKNFLEHCLISHLSSEPGHKGIILKLKKEPTRFEHETWRSKWRCCCCFNN